MMTDTKLSQKESQDAQDVIPSFLQGLAKTPAVTNRFTTGDSYQPLIPSFLQDISPVDVKSTTLPTLLTPSVASTLSGVSTHSAPSAPSAISVTEEIEISGTINHGYSLRHAFQIIGLLCRDVTLVFSNKGIFLTQVGCEDESLICLEITCGNILNYKFRYTDSKGKSCDSIGFNVCMKDVMLPFSSCAKKQSFIFQINDRAQMVCRLCDAKSDSTSQSASFIRFKEKQDEVVYEQPVFKRVEDDPNFSIQTSEFANMCKSIVKNKGKHTTITGYRKGFKIEGLRADRSLAYVSIHGDSTTPIATAKVLPSKVNTATASNIVNTAVNTAVDFVGAITGDTKSLHSMITPEMKENITKVVLKLIPECKDVVIRFNDKILKAFSKMMQLCPDGVTKLFFEYDQETRRQLPMKMITPISSYGKLIIYVRDAAN